MYLDKEGLFTTLDDKFSFDNRNILNLTFFEGLKFYLYNFAKEHNYSILSSKASKMFYIKLRLTDGSIGSQSCKSEGNFTLILTNLIITDDWGDKTDVKKLYLHNCEDKSVYETTDIKINEDSNQSEKE